MALGKEADSCRAFKDLDQIKADVVYPSCWRATPTTSSARWTVTSCSNRADGDVLRLPASRLPGPDQLAEQDVRGFGAAVRKDRYVESVKAHFLGLKSYRAFPTDAEFRDALETTDLYNFRRRSYFLRLLENHGRKEHVTIEDYTIEHILPQNENLSQAGGTLSARTGRKSSSNTCTRSATSP